MNLALSIAVGIAAGLAAFILASLLLLHKLTRLLEILDARDRDLTSASLYRFHQEQMK